MGFVLSPTRNLPRIGTAKFGGFFFNVEMPLPELARRLPTKGAIGLGGYDTVFER